ncbi:MAG: hypothetical protein RJQ09_20720 [Cyclobacteriaceae bacterium]
MKLLSHANCNQDKSSFKGTSLAITTSQAGRLAPVGGVNSYDKTVMEKVRLIDGLSDEERKTIFTILDAFVGKKKMKDTLENVLQDV